VLEARSDDATALTALGRWDDAFEANPFSMSLVREYQRYLRSHKPPVPDAVGVQRALVQLARGETRAARETLDALLAKFPANETLRTLRREAEPTTTVTLPR